MLSDLSSYYLVTVQGETVRVRRGIPGTDAGESEELVVVVGGQQIRELEPGTGVTRTQWDIHSLERCA